jgi:hypothetical protein
MNARETAIQALSVCRWCGNTDTANLRFDPIVDPPWLCQRCWEARNKIPIEEPIQALPPITTTTPKPHRTEGSYRRAPKAVRADAIAHYGGKCEWCEATEQLEFDHIHNDGAAHRRTLGDMPLEEWLQQEGYPLNIVRLLCRPCHELKTWGHVTQKTAKQRLVHSLRRRPDTMPPRHGATTVHITLAADANRLLDDLAALEPNKSKSRIIEGLIRQTMTTSNGHQVDLLSGLETRLEKAGADVEALASVLADLTPTLATLKGTIDRVERQQKEIINVLNGLYDQNHRALKEQSQRRWWQWW